LGYQLKQHMPQISQRDFPKEGHLLYENDDELSVLLSGAGFTNVRFVVKGESEAPGGAPRTRHRMTRTFSRFPSSRPAMRPMRSCQAPAVAPDGRPRIERSRGPRPRCRDASAAAVTLASWCRAR
jgi:hypothetical protein